MTGINSDSIFNLSFNQSQINNLQNAINNGESAAGLFDNNEVYQDCRKDANTSLNKVYQISDAVKADKTNSAANKKAANKASALKENSGISLKISDNNFYYTVVGKPKVSNNLCTVKVKDATGKTAVKTGTETRYDKDGQMTEQVKYILNPNGGSPIQTIQLFPKEDN